MRHGRIRVAPTDDEGAVPLRYRIADQRIGGLQIEDVKLVDARRDQQKRTLVHLGGERFVFQQLEQLVFKHHRTFTGGHVFAHLKNALVGHGHMALLKVVQHVLHALGDALAFGVYGFLLRLGVEGQEVAGRRRCGPLLHRKTNTRLGFVIGVQGFGQSHHGAGIEQIQGGRKR